MSPAEEEWVAPTLQTWGGGEYRKHLPYYERANDWENVVKQTSGERRGRYKKKPVSRYKHDLTLDQIRDMEFQCVTGAIGQPSPKKAGVFWAKINRVIGASLGKETEFIRVEVTNGVYHGYPVTPQELRQKDGVPWNQLR